MTGRPRAPCALAGGRLKGDLAPGATRRRPVSTRTRARAGDGQAFFSSETLANYERMQIETEAKAASLELAASEAAVSKP